MNILHKSLTIAFLAVSIFVSGLTVDVVGAGVKVYRHDPDDPNSLSHDSVVNILEDRTGTLWIGTYGGGINAFDRKTEQFIRYQHDPANPHPITILKD